MNILSIVLAATAAFMYAFLWNGPLFGKTGRRLAQKSHSADEPTPPRIFQIVLNYVVFLVTATIMSGVFWIVFNSSLMVDRNWYQGIILALWLWLGFNVTTSAIEVIWNGKPWKSWIFECAAAACVFAIMGAILGSF